MDECFLFFTYSYSCNRKPWTFPTFTWAVTLYILKVCVADDIYVTQIPAGEEFRSLELSGERSCAPRSFLAHPLNYSLSATVNDTSLN